MDKKEICYTGSFDHSLTDFHILRYCLKQEKKYKFSIHFPGDIYLYPVIWIYAISIPITFRPLFRYNSGQIQQRVLPAIATNNADPHFISVLTAYLLFVITPLTLFAFAYIPLFVYTLFTFSVTITEKKQVYCLTFGSYYGHGKKKAVSSEGGLAFRRTDKRREIL